MTGKLTITTVLGLLAIPAAALATKPPHPVHPNSPVATTTTVTTASTTTTTATPVKPHPTVLFVLHGTVSAYTAASGGTNGSLAITVKSSNHESSALKGATQPLTFVVSTTTKLVLHDGSAIATGDSAIVKIRAVKNAAVAVLEATPSFQVIDQDVAG